jgi:hypothetical protein
MKKGKVVLMGLVILAMFLVFTQPAGATWRWLRCTVDSVETDSDGVVTFTLSAVSTGATRSFVAPAGEENRMLSIALTAMTNGMIVKVYIDWPNSGTEIESMILLPAS